MIDFYQMKIGKNEIRSMHKKRGKHVLTSFNI